MFKNKFIFLKMKASTQTTSVDHSHSYDSFICFIYGIVHPVFMTFQLYSIYLTCAVTVDRWIYITFPLKVDTICSMRNTFKAIAGIFAFCVIYNLPRWFEIESFKVIVPTVTNKLEFHQQGFELQTLFDPWKTKF
jgi:hypothetical protein